MYKLFILLGIVSSIGCGKVTHEQELKGSATAEIIIRYPELSRCFDLFEAGAIDKDTFKFCVRQVTEHKVSVGVEGEIIELSEDTL